MAAALISDFVQNYIYPDVRGCDSANMTRAAIDAAAEFFTFSGIWDEVQDAVTLQADISEYDLEAPAGARCIDIKAVYASFADSGELVGVTLPQLAAAIPGWQTAEANLPSHYTRAFDFTSIRVAPIPTDPDGQAIRMHAVYTLKDNATTIPEQIYARYREVIASGAKARLMTMPRVPWQDLKLAGFHLERFEAGKFDARVAATYGKTAATLTVRPRLFGQ